MGEQDRALDEISDARARLSELADELARQAEPDRLKALAREKAVELKDRAKELASHKAVELKQHAKDAAVEKATELKTRTKETVMQRTMELRERADSPKGWSLFGALIGAGVGSALMRKAFTKRAEHRAVDRYDTSYGRSRDERWNEDDRWRYENLRAGSRAGPRYSSDDRYATAGRSDIGYGAGTSYGGVPYEDVASRGIGTSPVEGEEAQGVKARASEAAHNVKERAVDVKERAVDKASEVRERAVGKASEVSERAKGAVSHLKERAAHVRESIPSRDVVQRRTSDWFNRTLDEQPLLLALGGIAIGMLASILIPVSRKERQLIEPARRRAEEGISQLGDQLNQKLQGSESRGADMEDTGYSASSVSASSDLSTPASTSGTSSYGAAPASTSGIPVAGTEDNAEALTSSTTDTSRIPPLPPLDDLTKVR